MPTLNKYQNRTGYYLRARIDDSVITLQTTPLARELFDKLGFSHGSSISWDMVHRLYDRGDIYTRQSGVDSEETIGKPTTNPYASLSENQRLIYQRYLEQGIVARGSDEFDKNLLSDFLIGSRLTELPSEMREMLLESGKQYLIKSIESFENVPFRVEQFSYTDGCVIYQFKIDDSVLFTCEDKRWDNSENDFVGSVNYPDSDVSNASFTINNYYFVQWETKHNNGSLQYELIEKGQSNSKRTEAIKQIHKAAIRNDVGPKRSMGFDSSNWTEVVRKVLFYVRHYDVCPPKWGHRGLYSANEIEGKHILVDVHSTNNSSKKDAGISVVENELVRLTLPSVSKVGLVLVKVGPVSEGSARAHPV